MAYRVKKPPAMPETQEMWVWPLGHWSGQPTPVSLPGEFHGLRSLVGCSPWGCKELDVTERLGRHAHMHGFWWFTSFPGEAERNRLCGRLSARLSVCQLPPPQTAHAHAIALRHLAPSEFSTKVTQDHPLPQAIYSEHKFKDTPSFSSLTFLQSQFESFFSQRLSMYIFFLALAHKLLISELNFHNKCLLTRLRNAWFAWVIEWAVSVEETCLLFHTSAFNTVKQCWSLEGPREGSFWLDKYCV